MKQYLRNRVSKSASYLEILLSLLIVTAILIVAISLVNDLVMGVIGIANGSFSFNFRTFIGQIMQLVIGVEFVKMLSKHTPESTIEVLLFVVARKIIIEELNILDMAVGIIAIAILFLVRRYFTRKTDPEGCILEADTTIAEMNRILRTSCLAENCATVRELVTKEFDRQKVPLAEGEEIVYMDLIFKIHAIKTGAIDAIEVVPMAPRPLRWPWRKTKKNGNGQF